MYKRINRRKKLSSSTVGIKSKVGTFIIKRKKYSKYGTNMLQN